MTVPARSARLTIAALAVAGAALAAPSPAHADDGERISHFDASVQVEASGRVSVVEEIQYDFGPNARHGIFRFVPDRIPCTGAAVGPSCPKGKVRVIPLSLASVTVDGGPVDVSTQRQGDSTVWRIGDAARTITGSHLYQLRYTVGGALNPVDGGGAVFPWNVTGSGWTVPMDEVTVAVVAPNPTAVRCTTGRPGSTASCGETAPFRVAPLAAGSDVTLTVTLPAGAVASTAPVLERRKVLFGPFLLDVPAYGLAALAGLGGAAAVWKVGRRGRDRRFVGGDVEVAMGRAGQAEEHRPVLGGALPEVMEYAPPGNIRPGQLGALVDERVDSRDVAATIVDLAARGHLTLQELEGGDWRIGRGPKSGTNDLVPYEALLVDKLLDGVESVQLSALRQKWHTDYQAVSGALYDSLVAAGWYEERPDKARMKANGVAVLQIVAGVAVVVLARKTLWALAGAPLVLTGLATFVVARRAGVRTAVGTAMAARCGGFRRLIETPTQQEMAHFAERRNVFVDYLPFAIVFGCATQWAKRFAALGALPPPTGTWYVPYPGAHHGNLADVGDASWEGIARSVAGFAGSAASTLSAPAASGGSGSGGGGGGGFSSGGGFGGGGGGSW